MKVFKLVADIQFEANDVDDALLRLGEHFKRVGEGEESSLFTGGSIEISSREAGSKGASRRYNDLV